MQNWKIIEQDGNEHSLPNPEVLSPATAEQMKPIRKFESDYRAKHPNCSARQLRRAVANKFNMKIQS